MRFSVTIPAYKSQYLKEAIESVILQAYSDWELIIVDDCSPENLAAIVQPYLADQRIHYYRNERNCGAVDVVDNWNRCLSYCTADYVICMGDDDRLLPCCLEEYMALIKKYPGLDVYHMRTEIIDGDGNLINLQEPRPEWESALSMVWNRWASRDKQYIGDFCYSTKFLQAAGGYYKLPLAWGTDDITATLAAKEKGIANAQVFGFQYRENPLTITCSTDNARIKMGAVMSQYSWYQNLLKELSVTELSLTDSKYLKTIGIPQKEYYFKSLGKACTDYIKGSPLRLLECYRQLRPLHFSVAAYAKWYLSSVYSLFI